LSSWRVPWLEHVKKSIAKQIEEHEKEAGSIELYVLEFKHSRPIKGALYQIFWSSSKASSSQQERPVRKETPACHDR
jgi:hypothetical protein